MLFRSVGARHPRPKPNEKIQSTFDGQRPTVGHRGLKPNPTKFPFLRMGMPSDWSLAIGGVLRFSARFWARVARPLYLVGEVSKILETTQVNPARPKGIKPGL